MPEIFQCPACSAPLEFEGNTTQKCRFCGGSVIVPSEVFSRPSQNEPGQQPPPFGEATTDLQNVLERVRELLAQGKKIEAVTLFRDSFGVSLSVARLSVEAIERGQVVSANQAQAFTTQRRSKASSGIKGLVLFIVIAAFILPFIFSFIPWILVAFIPSNIGRERTFSSSPGDVGVSGGGETDGGRAELLRFGGKGKGAGKFTDNRVVTVDGSGRIYSTDYSGGRVQVFDGEGKFITQWTARSVAYTADLEAAPDGTVYLADSRSVRAFNGPDGKELASMKVSSPRGVEVGQDGQVYITTRTSIIVADKNLNIKSDFKKAAEDASSRLGFESIAVDGSGNIYAVTRQEGDIAKFSPQGKFLNRIKTDVRSPRDIAIDPAGNIFLTNVSTIHIFSPDGKALKTIKADQAFGLDINASGDVFVASRPEVVKYRIEPDDQ